MELEQNSNQYIQYIQPWYLRSPSQSQRKEYQNQQIKQYHLQYPKALEDDRYNTTNFQMIINSMKMSDIYDCIIKRYSNYMTIFKHEKDTSLKFQLSQLRYKYPEQLLQQEIENIEEFDDENELHLEYCSFIFFRLLFKSLQSKHPFHPLHQIFISLEMYFYNMKMMKYQNEIEDVLNYHNILLPQTNEEKQNEMYRIHFSKIVPLLTMYKFQISNGFVIVKKNELKTVLLLSFQEQLRRDLKSEASLPVELLSIENLLSDPIVEEFGKVIISQPVLSIAHFMKSNEIDKNQFFFPPCIYKILINMKQFHDIKFDARQQLSFFFFHLGIHVDQFMDYLYHYIPEKFKKERKLDYDFRHNFGQKGARITEPVWSCAKVCEAEVYPNNPLKFHGCPFNVLNKEILKDQLIELLEIYLLEWKVVDDMIDLKIDKFLEEIQMDLIRKQSNTQMCTRLLNFLYQLVSNEEMNERINNENDLNENIYDLMQDGMMRNRYDESEDIEDLDEMNIPSEIDGEIGFPTEFACCLNKKYQFCKVINK